MAETRLHAVGNELWKLRNRERERREDRAGRKVFDEANKSQFSGSFSLKELAVEGWDLLVDRDDAVLSREQAAQSNVRACARNGFRSIIHALLRCDKTRHTPM